MFGYIIAFVVFGLLLLVVAVGFRTSERAVNASIRTKRAHESSRAQPNETGTS